MADNKNQAQLFEDYGANVLAGVGGGELIVTLIYDNDTSSYYPDKTAQEMSDAYDSGQVIYITNEDMAPHVIRGDCTESGSGKLDTIYFYGLSGAPESTYLGVATGSIDGIQNSISQGDPMTVSLDYYDYTMTPST